MILGMNMICLITCLKWFEMASRLKVNLEKWKSSNKIEGFLEKWKVFKISKGGIHIPRRIVLFLERKLRVSFGLGK